MIKEKTIEKTVNEHYCDDCGKKLNRTLQCGVAVCEYCKKELCDNCVEYEDNNTGDYRTVYCKECWDIAKSYHSKINELENEIEELYTNCEKLCRAHRSGALS